MKTTLEDLLALGDVLDEHEEDWEYHSKHDDPNRRCIITIKAMEETITAFIPQIIIRITEDGRVCV